MAAAINILFRGKSMGGGFLWGAFAHAFLCLTVVLLNNPTRCSIPLTISAVGVLVSYAGGGPVALF